MQMDASKIKVCIFDVNGVLIDSNSANARAMAQAFTDARVLQQRIAELYLKLTGIDRGSKIRRIQKQLIRRPFKEKEFELLWERVKALARLSMLQAPIFGGSKEVLAELGRQRITRVALSNTPVFELQEILAAHTLESLLDIVRGGGDWPKSESLARLIREFQFEPDKCLFVGDGRGDLAAARYADVSFVAIDPGTGEFDGEDGFDGPYKNLAHWSQKFWEEMVSS
jgi:phosphoglycolate phosphatase-like HAD superfamily hydrolase